MDKPSTFNLKGNREDDVSDFAKRLAYTTESDQLLNNRKETRVPQHLQRLQKFSFGLGHVINDVLGVLWFSYALIFLQIVAKLTPTVSVFLMLLGQSVDAVATPFIGVLIDRIGTKKKWNAAGVLLIAVSFPFIFHLWSKNDSWLTVTYYALAILFFQIGWAIVQIAHLSLIPEITIFLQERAELTTLRYITFVCSNIIMYMAAYFIFQEFKVNNVNIIEPKDGWKFQVLAITAVCVGVLCSTIFQCVLKSPTRSKEKLSFSKAGRKTWFKLCRSSKLYLVALVHTTSRIFHSLNLVYTPFFINETNIRNSGILAMAPFFNFAAALVTSLIVTYTSKLYGNYKMLYTAGTIFSLLNCTCVYFNPDDLEDLTLIYAASIFCGIGSAMTIITSLCIAANYIGNDTEYGAFIYGLITFCDKIFNGAIIFTIEYLKCFGLISYDHYYKYVLTFVNGILTIIGYVFLLLLPSSICYST